MLFTLGAEAHLCNDVFVQAKDNLVVKVDVRDGQLRIQETGTFKVYLLNTMDRDIQTINLDVVTKDFTAKVTPDPSWRRHPQLRTVNRGGQKQSFEVELTRKKKTKKGKYKISLLLYGRNKNQVFKSVDINAAMANMEVPKASKSLKIDGKMKSSEWKKGLLFTSFHEYKKSGKYMQNFTAAQQTRVRLFYDKENLYCFVDLQKKLKKGKECSDSVKIYFAKDQSKTPETITVDFKDKKVTCSSGSEGIESKIEKGGTKMEIKIPLECLAKKVEDDKDKKKKKDDKSPKTFWINITREAGSTTTYWRGNPSSVKNPVAFARIIFKEWY